MGSDIEFYFCNWPSIPMDRILDPLCMRTIVRRIKEIKNESERIRAADTNWNTDLSFPVRIMDRLMWWMRIYSREDSYSTLESFKRKMFPSSELGYNRNIQTLPLCFVNALAGWRMIYVESVQEYRRSHSIMGPRKVIQGDAYVWRRLAFLHYAMSETKNVCVRNKYTYTYILFRDTEWIEKHVSANS
jgi:hypothetical protein